MLDALLDAGEATRACILSSGFFNSPFDGKWVFVGALVLVLIWLIAIPRRLVGQGHQVPPWWRNVRIWAIVICLVQIWVYWRFA